MALNEWIKNYAAENKITYLDYYPAMADEKGMLRKELTVTVFIRTMPAMK